MLKQYVVNDLYFLLTFADVPQCYPRIHSYIYVGMNLFGDEVEDTWYFGRLTPSATYRSISKVPSNERQIEGFTASALPMILEIDELKMELEKAKSLRLRSGQLRNPE